MNTSLNKLQVNMRCRGIENAFMKIGDEYEYEKGNFKKMMKVNNVTNGSDVDEEGTLAQAYTRFDNDEDECPEMNDQFDEYENLDSEGVVQNDLLTDNGRGNRRYQEHALSSKKSKTQRRVFYSPS